MARQSFSEDKATSSDWTMFSLDKPGTARVILLEDSVYDKWSHWIMTPSAATRAARVACLLEEQGECLACQYTDGSDINAVVQARSRRGMLNIVQYGTHPDGRVASPIVLFPSVWEVTQRVINQLHTKVPEIQGDIRKRDIIVKRENQAYRVYDIDISERCVALGNEAAVAALKQAHQTKRTDEEFSERLGKDVTPEEMYTLVSTSGVRGWQDSSDVMVDMPDSSVPADASLEDIMDVVDEPAPEQAETEDTLSGNISLDDILG